jgi:hypothetical protein
MDSLVEAMSGADAAYLARMDGMHEIHITVDPGQVLLLRLYCRERGVKPIFAVARQGGAANQLMISKFTPGKPLAVIAQCLDMAADMRRYGLTPIRCKVEATMHVNGGPQGWEVPLWSAVPALCGYWEFHMKVAAAVPSLARLEELETLCRTLGVYVSENALKADSAPLVTLRLQACTRDSAQKRKEAALAALAAAGFECDSVQQELAVYDDNRALDAAWMRDPTTAQPCDAAPRTARGAIPQ